MKSIRFIIALLCTIGACPKSAQSTEVDDLFGGSYIPEVYEQTGRSVSWLEHGNLYYNISTKTGMRFFRYVKENSSEEFYTDGSLASVSAILAHETIQNSNDEMIVSGPAFNSTMPLDAPTAAGSSTRPSTDS